MDAFSLASARSFLSPTFPGGRIPATAPAVRQLPSRPGNRHLVVVVSAARGEDDKEGADKAALDKWDRMELKFGQYLGEDPELTIAKIKARKKNPGVSMLDVEKQFRRNKGKVVEIEELPFDVSRRPKKLSSSADGTPDLVRPIPRKGVQFEDKSIPPSQKLNEPKKSVAGSSYVSKPSVPDVLLRKPEISLHGRPKKSVAGSSNVSKPSVPDVLLRKPEMSLHGRPKKLSSRVITPNSTLKTSKDRGSTKTFSDVMLLRKPEPSTVAVEEEQPTRDDGNNESFLYARGMAARTGDCLKIDEEGDLGVALLKKPEAKKDGPQNSAECFPGPIAHNGDDEKERKRKVEGEEEATDKEDDLGIALLKKPEAPKNGPPNSVKRFPGSIAHNGDNEMEKKRNVEGEEETTDKEEDLGIALLKKPEALKNGPQNSVEGVPGPIAHSGDNEKERRRKVVEEEEEENARDDSMLDIQGMQPETSGTTAHIDRDGLVDEHSDPALNDSAPVISLESALQVKPRRPDPSAEQGSASSKKSSGVGSSDAVDEIKNIVPLSALEDVDWTRAENLVETGEKEEVQLISASLRGYTVLFGSLVGFLPYNNLTTKWKFLAFESWLSQKGLNPSRYKENNPIIGSYDAADKKRLSNSTNGAGVDRQNPAEVTADMKLRDLQSIYDQEKLKFLFSSGGQSMEVKVVMADRKLKKLIVSLRPREKDEVLEKKRKLMARLQIGDVVKCCIKKITYCGIFVEIEDVTALIHQTDISWDASLNAVSYYKVGQIVEAKVIQLDFPLERIYLSLKETMPDPLTKPLDHLGGDRDPLNGTIEAAEGDAEWPEVESLIEELQQIEGVQTVSKGRFSLRSALAPSFQVYMASINDKQYKLLARSGNKVQEVIVQASLSKEQMASTILSCATRVNG